MVVLWGLPSAASALEQTLTLRTGWNLISLHLTPTTPELPAVFGAAAGRVQQVYGFDGNAGSAGEWHTFNASWASTKPSLNDLRKLEAGLGYWVLLSDGSDVRVTIAGTSALQPVRTLRAGWHLIGLGNTKPILWADALGRQADFVEALMAFDPSQGFFGFEDPVFQRTDTDGDGEAREAEFDWSYGTRLGMGPPDRPTLTLLRPGEGYWVRFWKGATFGPSLEVETPNDFDIAPPEACAGDPPVCTPIPNSWEPGGAVDEDWNGNGLLDYGYSLAGVVDDYGNPVVNTQDTITFSAPKLLESPAVETSRIIRIVNKGSGILHFSVSAENEQGQPLEGLTIDPPSGEVPPGQPGIAVSLRIDPTSFPVGTTNARLFVTSSGGNLQVPDSEHPGLNRSYVRLRIAVPDLFGRSPENQASYEGFVILFDQLGNLVGRLPMSAVVRSGGARLRVGGTLPLPGEADLIGTVANGAMDLAGSLLQSGIDAANPFGLALRHFVQLKGSRDCSEAGEKPEVSGAICGSFFHAVQGLGSKSFGFRGSFVLVPEGQGS